MSLYNQRGVSSQKEDVHKATRSLHPGLFKNSFCKIYPDFLGSSNGHVNVMHSDGAGTKSILAYLYWRETGNVNVWKGVARDAIVMNLDDLLCVGIINDIVFSSTIDRNKLLIPGEVLEAIIEGSREFFDHLRQYGIEISYLGGETADVGDVVRTISINGTMCARWPKEKLITNDRITPGDVIVGVASFGQATYETEYNSGIGSNGLTSARHDLLHKNYGLKFPETIDPKLPDNVVYVGPYQLEDSVPNINKEESNVQVGNLLLSSTRTYAPVVKKILNECFGAIHGMVHCSGGGQTKCLKYLPGNFRVVKDNLFNPPTVFELIKRSSGADDKEMYQVFNMGHRLEIFTEKETANEIIDICRFFNIDAKVVGRVEASSARELVLQTASGSLTYC